MSSTGAHGRSPAGPPPAARRGDDQPRSATVTDEPVSAGRLASRVPSSTRPGMVPDVGLRPGLPAGGARRRAGRAADVRSCGATHPLGSRIACTRDGRHRRRRSARLVVATGARVGPVAVVCFPIAWRRCGRPPAVGCPTGDDAYFTVRSRDVLTAHHPLLGAWSSGSLDLETPINNLGPIQLDLLAPFTRLDADGRHGDRRGVGQHRRDRRHRLDRAPDRRGAARCCRRCWRSAC